MLLLELSNYFIVSTTFSRVTRTCDGLKVSHLFYIMLHTLRKRWDQFASHIRYEVGDGSQLLFWKNYWDGDGSLQLFRFARDKDARVSMG